MEITAGNDNRIPVLHLVLSMELGGAEKLVHDMVLATPPERYRPLVACLQGPGLLGRRLEQRGVPLFCKGKKEGLDWSVFPWLVDLVRRERIRVIHAHQYTPLFYATLAMLRFPRVGIVYTEHGRLHPDPKRLKRSLINPFLARRVGVLAAIADSTAQAMQRIDNFPAQRIQVINNGVDCSRFPAGLDAPPKPEGLVIPEGALLVGTAARLEQVKNLPMMLRSFQIVLEQVPRALLLLAGAGSEREALGRLAEELGIADRVLFLGHRDDLDALLPLLRVFLLSSFTEGISVTLLESMACGVPAVVTRVGGNLDIVIDGVTGYLVDSGDQRGFARQVIHYLNNPDLARVHGIRARERVRERFSFQTMLDAYFGHYDALAGTRL